jgi:hypothetical protein
LDFTPQQQHSLLTQMGYNGPTDSKMMEAFLSSNPGAAARMGKFSRVVKQRAGMATGGTVTNPVPQTQPAPTTQSDGNKLTEAIIQNPADLTVRPEVAQVTVTPDTLIDTTAGSVGAAPTVATTTVTDVAQTKAPVQTPASLIESVTTATPAVKAETDKLKATTGTVSEAAQVTAAQQTQSSLSNLKAEQGTGILMNNPVQRKVEEGELISGSTVDASRVNALAESIQAAEATPTKQATVQGQLEGLMQQFEGGNTPAWAAGAMRAANATLAARGLGASSLAGQAVIQAAMESALPIAQADANTRAQFESQNLSNRQATAIFSAQQRAAFLGQEFDQNFQSRVLNAAKVADIANMNFTAEQNIAMENSRIVNTVNLENLSNRQSMVMAQAAALANMDTANLNNRQQAAVQNAQAFLQMDLTNVNNTQQTEMFRTQSNIQALLTDQAAQNAAQQFNAASENQTNQFFADLTSRANQFNAEQSNAIKQFNAGETNAAEKFNAQIKAQRDQFNATNSLVIAQANAQWRQNTATLNTAAQNDANMEMAKTQNALTGKALDQIWQSERDVMAYAFTALESTKDRAADLMLADKRDDLVKMQSNQAEESAKFAVLAKLVFGGF